MIGSETVLIVLLNDLAMLAAYFLASAARQNKLGIVEEVAKALGAYAPGAVIPEIGGRIYKSLRPGEKPAQDGKDSEDSGEIPISGGRPFGFVGQDP